MAAIFLWCQVYNPVFLLYVCIAGSRTRGTSLWFISMCIAGMFQDAGVAFRIALMR